MDRYSLPRRVLQVTSLLPMSGVLGWAIWIAFHALPGEESPLHFLRWTAFFAAWFVGTALILFKIQKRMLKWIFDEHPVAGSMLSMGLSFVVCWLVGLGLALMAGIPEGSLEFGGMFIYVSMFGVVLLLPGMIVGFYANAHAFTYLSGRRDYL